MIPRVLAQRGGEKEDEEEDGDEYDYQQQQQQQNRDNFVQDPALLRAQAEQRRAAKMGQTYQPRQQPKDVVGKLAGRLT